MIATAPGKLILTGEYAVLDGAPALVVAVNRRVVARRRSGPTGSSPFLIAVADEIARVYGADHPATQAAMDIVCDSSAFFLGNTKLGLGSSAAVTVAATALAIGAASGAVPVIDREAVLAIASAAHANAQGSRPRVSSADLSKPRIRAMSYSDLSAQVLVAQTTGVALGGEASPATKARGSGADIASAVHGGVIAFEPAGSPSLFEPPPSAAPAPRATPLPFPVLGSDKPTITRLVWPAGVILLPFFTGAAADTAELVMRVTEARETNRAAVEAALVAIAKASRAACQACAAKTPEIAANALLAGLELAANATDELAKATDLPLVPPCVSKARQEMRRIFGGTAKTTGAGGGDVAIAVIPATRDDRQRQEDVTKAERLLIEAGCQPLGLTVDTTGVDLQPDAE